MSERFADEGSIVTKPLQDDDIMERAHSGFELFNTASGALIFIADGNGNILLHTGDDAFHRRQRANRVHRRPERGPRHL